MEAPIYDERDKALIRWFAERYRNHLEQLGYNTFCEHLKFHRAECGKIRSRMLTLGVIDEDETGPGNIVICPFALNLSTHGTTRPCATDGTRQRNGSVASGGRCRSSS